MIAIIIAISIHIKMIYVRHMPLFGGGSPVGNVIRLLMNYLLEDLFLLWTLRGYMCIICECK